MDDTSRGILEGSSVSVRHKAAIVTVTVIINVYTDMWWLGLSLFLFCVIERSKIQNETNYQWFTVFAMSSYHIYNALTSYSSLMYIIVQFLSSFRPILVLA